MQNDIQVRAQRGPAQEPYINESERTVKILGVELEKGEGGTLVPPRIKFENFFFTETDYIRLRDLAMSIKLKRPMLGEEGPGVGKTAAAGFIASMLNLNLVQVYIDPDTRVEDVIGGKTISVDDQGREQVSWFDGPLITAVRHGGLASVDEYNKKGTRIGDAVKPIIDAVLAEDTHITIRETGERVPIHPNFSIVAWQNPPGTEDGQEFTGREQLSADRFSMWWFRKGANDMSRADREKRMAGRMGESVSISIPKSAFRESGVGTPIHELHKIDGMSHWRRAMLDVLDQIKSEVSSHPRTLAADQKQRIYILPRLEDTMLRYVAERYQGDVNQVWFDAFEDLIIGMFKSDDDKRRIREMLGIQKYEPQPPRARAREAVQPTTEHESPAARPETLEGKASVEAAERILGPDFFGEKDVKAAFGLDKIDLVPPIPFTEAELRDAKRLGQQLILFTGTMALEESGGLMRRSTKKNVPLTMQHMKQAFTTAHDSKPFMYEQGWYNSDPIFTTEIPRIGWRLVSKDVVPNTPSKNYIDQTVAIIDHLKKEVFKTGVPREYQAAFAEFERQKDAITATLGRDWRSAAEQLAKLKITKLVRETPVETLYRMRLNDAQRKTKTLPVMYSWSASRTADGYFAYVGVFDAEGLSVHGREPDVTYDFLGASLSRS